MLSNFETVRPSPVALIAISSIFVPLLLAVSVARICIRGRKFGWDDGILVAGLSVMVLHQFLFWSLKFPSPTGLVEEAVVRDRAISFYVCAVCLRTMAWLGRISTLLTIVRITPDYWETQLRRGIAAVFSIAYLIILLLVLFPCSVHLVWSYYYILPACALQRQIPITEMIASLLADVILVYLPYSTLHELTSDNTLRRRLRVTFFLSMGLTSATCVQSALALFRLEWAALIAAFIEAFLSLFICSLPVVTAAMVHAFSPKPKRAVVEGTEIRFASKSHDSTISECDLSTLFSRPESSHNSLQDTEDVDITDSRLYP